MSQMTPNSTYQSQWSGRMETWELAFENMGTSLEYNMVCGNVWMCVYGSRNGFFGFQPDNIIVEQMYGNAGIRV